MPFLQRIALMIKERFLELDALRGIAIILMVVFHFLFDLNFFKGLSFDLSAGVWLFVGRSSALIFLLLVGISLTLSFSKGRNFTHFLKRGLGIFALGLLITAITFFLFPQETIWFGILHLIGISIILAFPFLKFKWKNIAFGVVIIAVGVLLWGMQFSFPWLLPLGLTPQGFASFDYFPVLPSFGIVLLGIALGNWLYPKGKRRAFGFREGNAIAKFLALLGRHSLIIYLLHQPAIIAVLLLL